MEKALEKPRTYLLAEFSDQEKLLHATSRTREQGFSDLDTYSPYPLHGGSEALGLTRSWVPTIALGGGLTGAIGGYVMMWWMNAVDYPILVGNRSLHPIPSFIPITFECGVLCAALSIFFGLMFLSRLPQPYHPTFELDAFRSASTHAFWLSVGIEDEKKRESLSRQLTELGAIQVATVQESTK